MKSIRTMRRFFTAFRMTIWMFLPVLVALAGCEPEPLPVSFGVESGGQEVTPFDFGVMSYEGPSTKAYAADVEDGLVDRIDIFMYDGSGNIYGHKGINREYFQKKYPHLHIKGAEDDSMKDNQYRVIPQE